MSVGSSQLSSTQSAGQNSDSTAATHPLAHPYALWFTRRSPGARSQESYSQNLILLGVFKTIEDFWMHYSFLLRPNDFNGICDYHLFKEGIMPMWEDGANENGGKWIVRLRKGLASRYWENLLLAIIGNQFDVGDEICGAVVSVRYNEDIISVWNRTASDTEANLKIKDTIKRVLGLPSTVVMEYKVHMDSRIDNSSYRNTDVFQ